MKLATLSTTSETQPENSMMFISSWQPETGTGTGKVIGLTHSCQEQSWEGSHHMDFKDDLTIVLLWAEMLVSLTFQLMICEN
jgi:hypothetical protein